MRSGADVPKVLADVKLTDALLEITQKGMGMTAIVDRENRPVGVFTDGDLRRHVDQLLTACAREVMTTHPQTIFDTTYAGEALRIMTERRITALFVVTEDQPRTPVGLVHIHDLSPPTFG